MLLAATAGLMRSIENTKHGARNAYGATDEVGWQISIEGALGEFALSKFLGVHWSGKGDMRAPDVGEVDVRTRSRDYYDLILHPNDPDDRVFWLLCGAKGVYSVKGWILGKEGKRAEYWNDPAGGRPAFFVPQSKLNPPTK